MSNCYEQQSEKFKFSDRLCMRIKLDIQDNRFGVHQTSTQSRDSYLKLLIFISLKIRGRVWLDLELDVSVKSIRQ